MLNIKNIEFNKETKILFELQKYFNNKHYTDHKGRNIEIYSIDFFYFDQEKERYEFQVGYINIDDKKDWGYTDIYYYTDGKTKLFSPGTDLYTLEEIELKQN